MNSMSAKTRDPEILREISLEIRGLVIRSLAAAGSGHLGGSLGLADLFTHLYFSRMNHSPAVPSDPDRDRLILSIGHVAPVFYATLARAGYFPEEELMTLRKLGSRLQGHPGKDHGLPGIEISSGSLGQGLSVSVGLGLSAKIDGASWRVYCIHGDGELQEGSVWEALMSASHHKLDNITLIVDCNGVQIDGPTSRVMELEPLRAKFESFGWRVEECDGNDHQSLLEAFDRMDQVSAGKPLALLARTRMGAGVPEIEGDYRWHGAAPTQDQADSFIRQVYESHLRQGRS
jgi:transketolase